MATFLADIHIDNFPKWGGPVAGGLNDRGRLVLGVLARAVSQAVADQPLVILGDIFNRCQPSPALLAHTQTILSEHPGPVILMVGNHDQESDSYGHNALAPLVPVVALVVEKPTVFTYKANGIDRELWLVPFQAGPAADWLPDALAGLAQSCCADVRERALCLHMGLSDEGTPYYLDATAGSINVRQLTRMCTKHCITHVFSGDWHRHQRWDVKGVTVVQVGALCPSRFPPNYEHGDKGPMAVWDSTGVHMTNVPGPRFYKLTMDDLGWAPPSDASPAYVRIRYQLVQAEEAHAFGATLKAAHPETIAGLEYDVDREAERAQAHTASFAARQASSLEEAIRVYVDNMPLPDEVSREVVLKHTRRLLG